MISSLGQLRASTPRWWVGAALLGAVVGLMAGRSPALGIGLSLALAFVLVAFSDLGAGVALFTFVTFLNVVPAGVGASVSAIKLAGLPLLAAWLGALSRSDAGVRPRSGRLGALLAAMLAWLFLSRFWAGEPSETTSAVARALPTLWLPLLVIAAVRERHHARWVVQAFVAGSALAAAYGLATDPGGSGAGLERVGGTIGDPNELAAVLVAGLALALALARAAAPRSLQRTGALAAGGLCAAGVLLSLSRGGLVALVVALAVSVVVAGRRRVGAIALALVACAAVVTYFVAVAPPDAAQRVTNAAGGTGRTDLWRVGWRMVEAHPLVGVGAGNYQSASIAYLLEPGALQRSDLIAGQTRLAHNTYLQILAELGIVGLAVFAAIVVVSLRAAWRAASIAARHGDAELELLARGVIVALAGLLTASFFLPEQFNKQLWLLLGLGPALLFLAARDYPEIRGSSR